MRLPSTRYSDGVTDRLILITLLVKLGVMASVASVLARASSFRRLFFAEIAGLVKHSLLLAFFLVPLTLGVWVRTAVPNFLAADISFETVILLGLLLGPVWAVLGGHCAGRAGASPWRISGAAVQCVQWGCLRGYWPTGRDGGDLVFHAVH